MSDINLEPAIMLTSGPGDGTLDLAEGFDPGRSPTALFSDVPAGLFRMAEFFNTSAEPRRS